MKEPLRLCTNDQAGYENTAVGDIVLFGQYPQKDLEKQDIRWIVLKKESGKLLLLSEAILDYSNPENMQCDPKQLDTIDWGDGYPRLIVNWNTDAVCFWLNNYFYQESFSAEEKNLIQKACVSIDDEDRNKIVRNKVFLLSKKEMESLLPEKYNAYSPPVTDYAFLRSGEEYGYDIDASRENPAYRGIRPAICISAGRDESSLSTDEKKSALLSAKQGDHVKIGHRYQKDYPWVEENMEWIVLSKGRNRKLLLSRDCVDYRKMGGESWEKSELRKWLNGDFLSKSFTAEERKMIQQTNLTFNTALYSDKPRSSPTTDRVFLLGVTEVERYLDIIEKQNDMSWWLRDDCGIGDMDLMFGYCYSNNVGRNFGCYVGGVRPAIWVEIQ